MSSFDIVFRTAASLHPDGEPDRFISAHTAVIRRTRSRDDKAFKVGRVKAYRIHADLAAQAGESLLDVCDCHSQEMHDLYAALSDPEADDLRADVRTRLDVFDNDILVLEYILLSP